LAPACQADRAGRTGSQRRDVIKDLTGSKVPAGTYRFRVECSWWPSMRYEELVVPLTVGAGAAGAKAKPGRFIPYFEARYYP